MKFRNRILVLITLSFLLIGCQNISNENIEETQNEVTIEVSDGETSDKAVELGIVNETIIRMATKEEAIEVLAADDDYTSKLSLFDYAAKFKSENIMSVESRESAYDSAVIQGTEDIITRLSKTVDQVEKLLSETGLNLPGEITIIITNGKIESGAAYTRGKSIIFPQKYIEGLDDKGLLELFLHELFHVYSRHNIDKREEMYAVIGYEKCEDLVFPDILKEVTIANPDAPDNNYYITCDYDGSTYEFIPIIYSNEKYNGGSFFSYLNDDMLAVEVADNIPEAVYVNDELLIVKKEELVGFYEKIGNNTNYTYHPEETLADNFVLLVIDAEVTDPWVLEGLSEIIFKNMK